MKLRINIYTAISALVFIISLTAFWAFSNIFGEVLVFYLGIPFALSTFFFFLQLLHPKREEAIFKTQTKTWNFMICLLTGVSVVSVLLVPRFEGPVELMKNAPLSWLRYLSSVALTAFLPGYFLLKILDRKSSIRGYTVLVLSYLLSVFVTFLAGFSILTSCNSISSLATPTVAVICLALMIFCHVIRRKTDQHFILSLDWFEVGLISAVLGVVMVGSATIMKETLPLRFGDMSRHHGIALQLLERFPVYDGKLITHAGGYLFHIYLAVLFALSGVPSFLAEQGLFVISFMPLLAFYSAIKTWFPQVEGKKFPALALFFSVLLGFGGLYALHSRLVHLPSGMASLLRRTTSKTYDVYMRFLYLPDNVAPIFYIGLPVFFSLLYLLKKNRARDSITRALIVSFLVAVGYMGHASEVIFFLAALFIYAILSRRANETKMGLCVLLGLLVVSILDLVAPAQIYVLSKADSTTLSLPFVLSVTLGILTYIIETMKDKHSMDGLNKFKTKILVSFEMLWRYTKWFLLYSYLFLVVIWLTVVDGFSLWAWGGTAFTPFFVLPIRLGPVGVLAIISIVVYLPTAARNRNLFFLLSLIPLGFILEQLASYYPSILTYPSYRYGTLTFIGCCLIASYGVVQILSRQRTSLRFSPIKRKIVVCVLLIPLLTSGFLTTTLYYINASIYHKGSEITEDELNALNYIRRHLSKNASVLTFTDQSAHRLRTFAGINAVQDAQRWSKHLLETSNPYIMTYILALSNVRYVYVSEKDNEISESNKILRSLVKTFPNNFENREVTIYEIPPLNPPSQQANLGLFYLPRTLLLPENVSWRGNSFANRWTRYRTHGNIRDHGWKVDNEILEGWVTSNQSGTVSTSYALSELSLNTTMFPTLTFRYKVENENSWFALQLWNSSNKAFVCTGNLTDQDFTAKTYMLPENQTIARIELIVQTTEEAPINVTARTFVDYIELTTPTYTWSDEAFLEDWSFYRKHGNVYNWTATSDGDILKIGVVSNQSGNSWISYSTPLVLNASNSLLSFRYCVETDDTWLTIRLRDAKNKVIFYKGHLTDRKFTTKTYEIPNSQIARIEIIVETSDKSPPRSSAIAYIDHISITLAPFSGEDIIPALFAAFLKTEYSTIYLDEFAKENLALYLSKFKYVLLNADPQKPLDDLLEWVANGNTLIVLNGHGYGFFARLLGEQSLSNSIVEKDFGLGKIVYWDVFSAIESSNILEILRPHLIEEVRKKASIIEHYVHRISILPVYNSTFNDIMIFGNLTLKSNLTTLEGSITFQDTLISGESEFNEIEILNETTLSINRAEFSISPLESYLSVKCETLSVSGEINLCSKSLLMAFGEDGANNQKVKLEGVKLIRFTANRLSINARLPVIDISGTATFDCLDVHSALYIPLARIVQEQANIEGNINFSTRYITKPMIMVSPFQVDGLVSRISDDVPDRSIPWVEAFVSPYNLILISTICIGAIFDVKRKKRTSNHACIQTTKPKKR